jgi:hypothetical protein
MGGCYDTGYHGACREPYCTKEAILLLDSLSGRNSKASGSMVPLIITGLTSTLSIIDRYPCRVHMHIRKSSDLHFVFGFSSRHSARAGHKLSNCHDSQGSTAQQRTDTVIVGSVMIPVRGKLCTIGNYRALRR